jgi:hypothetical protein
MPVSRVRPPSQRTLIVFGSIHRIVVEIVGIVIIATEAGASVAMPAARAAEALPAVPTMNIQDQSFKARVVDSVA